MRKAALILAFRREKETINLARQAVDQGINSLYLHLDGSHRSGDLELQLRMINSINSICASENVEFTYLHQNSNLGLRNAILAAVDWFFSNEPEGYILEDDLVLSEKFFDFCQEYKNALLENKRCLIISGNQFERNLPQGIYLSEYPFIWGWFTNAANWTICKKLITGTYIGKRQHLPHRVKNFWEMGNWKARTGLVNSWAIPLAHGFRNYEFYCLLPSTNMVSNIGNDQHATHTDSNNVENNLPINEAEITILMNNHFTPPFRVQSSKYVEKYVYRIKFRNNFSGLKLLFLRSYKAIKKLS